MQFTSGTSNYNFGLVLKNGHLQNSAYYLEVGMSRNISRLILLIVGYHDGLHMHIAIAVGELFTIRFVWNLLIIDFDIAIAVIDEDADFTNANMVTLLHPHDLSVMVNRLHTVTGNTEAKFCTFRNGGFREANHFKVAFIKELTSTGGNSQVADGHFDELDNLADHRLRLVAAGGNKVITIFSQLGNCDISFNYDLSEGADETVRMTLNGDKRMYSFITKEHNVKMTMESNTMLSCPLTAGMDAVRKTLKEHTFNLDVYNLTIDNQANDNYRILILTKIN